MSETDALSAQVAELNQRVSGLSRSMEEVQRLMRDVLTVDKANNQVTVQAANYLCKAVGEILGETRYLFVSQNVQNGITVNRPEDASRYNELLALMWPQSVSGFPQVRLGNGGDGGYVLLQDFDSLESVYSLGICDDVSFDLDIVRHAPGVTAIWQFDDSVDRPPVENPKFRFARKRINTVSDLGVLSPNSLLKIDIEGSEWDFFLSCSDEELNRFKQITCEFHDFFMFRSEAWYARARAVFEKLHRTHQAIHLHGNNIAPPLWTGDRFAPAVWEATFVRRTDYVFVPNQESLPGRLDAPCSILFPEVKVELSGPTKTPGKVSSLEPLQGERFKIDL